MIKENEEKMILALQSIADSMILIEGAMDEMLKRLEKVEKAIKKIDSGVI